jgi:hypothetical protein
MTLAWDLMQSNATFEQSCYEQAKAEVPSEALSGIEWIRKVAQRAQEIKLERRLCNRDTLRLWGRHAIE